MGFRISAVSNNAFTLKIIITTQIKFEILYEIKSCQFFYVPKKFRVYDISLKSDIKKIIKILIEDNEQEDCG